MLLEELSMADSSTSWYKGLSEREAEICEGIVEEGIWQKGTDETKNRGPSTNICGVKELYRESLIEK